MIPCGVVPVLLNCAIHGKRMGAIPQESKMMNHMASSMKILVPLILVVFTSACKHQPDVVPEPPMGGGGGFNCDWPGWSAPAVPVVCDDNIVYYEQDVLPIIMRSCALTAPNNSNLTCHHSGHSDSDLNFTVFSNFQEEANDGEIHEVIHETDPDDNDMMPPPGEEPLTQAEIDIIDQWIAQGANFNSCEECDTTAYTYSGTIAPMIALHCAGGCHAGSTPAAGLNLTSYNVLSANVGRAWLAISHCGQIPMPPVGPQLSDCKLQKFYNWMNAGAPQN